MTMQKNYSVINRKFDDRLDHMTSQHNKVTFFRFDVQFPKDYPHDGTNQDFSNFLKLLKEPLTRQDNEMHYVWCREQNKSENPHHHVAALVNGSQTQRVDGILQHAADIWERITGSSGEGLIDHCNRFKGQSVPAQIRIDRPSSKKTGDEFAQQVQALEECKA